MRCISTGGLSMGGNGWRVHLLNNAVYRSSSQALISATFDGEGGHGQIRWDSSPRSQRNCTGTPIVNRRNQPATPLASQDYAT